MTRAALLATWFGCGLSRKAHGTVGSMGALLPAVLYLRATGAPPATLLAPVLLLTWPAIWAAERVANEQGLKDPQLVVVDEVLGQWIALAGATTLNWKSVAAAFVLFRIFDIAKPQPIRSLESLPGGMGIIADDLMAGIYAALVLFAAGWFNLY